MPHSKGVNPEAEAFVDERDRPRNPPNVNGELNPPLIGAAGRRDENPINISFRHFLQQHSDVVPTTTRHNRSSRDLVDGASASLPDFVQDHLVLESAASAAGSNIEPQAGNSHHSTGSSVDMSVLNSVLPDFTTSQRNQSCMSKRNRRHQENAPNSGEGASSSSTSHGPVALPDFLSDGPMLCSNNVTDHNTPSPSSAVGTSSSLHRVDNASRESDSQHVERLRRELAEKSRRLSQLENDFTASRNEASMFEMAYHTAQQSLEAANRRALAAEAQVAKLKSDLAFLKDQFTDKPSRRRSDNSNTAGKQGVVSYTGQNAGSSTRSISNSSSIDSLPSRVMEIARSSEILVGQLLEQLDELKYVATTDLKGEESRQNSSSKDKGKVERKGGFPSK